MSMNKETQRAVQAVQNKIKNKFFKQKISVSMMDTNTTETAKSNGIFRYHYSKMKYYFMMGGKCNKMAVVHGNTAMTIYENDIVLRGQADPDNNMGKFISSFF